MKHSFKIFMLLFLFAIPSKMAFACGNTGAKMKMNEKTCSKDHHKGKKKSCCGDEKKEKKGCDGSCNGSSCTPSSAASLFVVLNNFSFDLTPIFPELKSGFLFRPQFLKSLSNSIWQPPKIG